MVHSISIPEINNDIYELKVIKYYGSFQSNKY